MRTDFEREYKKLNQAQKEAVDTIHGPLMVVAGPGTGKTQLLSMRVANILRLSDALPRNILCLTFTDSAATAMRERLLGLIGIDAHKVAIHTFHSFGVEVINQYPEFFYRGAEFKPSDEVLQIEILHSILDGLPHDDPLSATMNDQFVYLRSINQTISYLKRAGLDADNLRRILEINAAAVETAEPILRQAFNMPRLNKSHFEQIRAVVPHLNFSRSVRLPEPFAPLLQVLRSSLESALSEAEESGSTKPLTAWKNNWLEKDGSGQYILKERSRSDRLGALADIYEQYQTELISRGRYDFSDMVLQVLESVGTHPELRFALQEQYQFILVDEFQDTNDGQLRLLYLLADNPVHEGKPDVMVVGDDDQAIYKFQGAEINNIINFHNKYPALHIVTLTENYRSTQDILDLSRRVISQVEFRLETALNNIDKTPASHKLNRPGTIECRLFESKEHEYAWIAEQADQLVKKGIEPKDIAIIGRQHAHLEALMPHLNAHQIPVMYERRQNILAQHHIVQLIDMAYTVHYLASNKQDLANEYISRVLSYPFWGINSTKLWHLSRQAYGQQRLWLEVMLDSKGELKKIAEFLTECAALAGSEPMEYVIDSLTGASSGGSYTSPYRQYYFSQKRFDTKRSEYVVFLSGLNMLRQKLREYRNIDTVYLADFVNFIEVHRTNQMPIVDETPFITQENAVTVTTAHKAKGQEFETVFVISSQESVWASSSGRQQIRFPENLPIAPPGDALDDQLRLFFVSLTRAKSSLFLSGYKYEFNGKASLLVPFIDHHMFEPEAIKPEEIPKILERSWQSYHPLGGADAEAVLRPVLNNYQLNVTHFTKFLDVARSGPREFLLESLMRFPKSTPPSAAYGTAVHETLRELYKILKQAAVVNIETALEIFDIRLRKQRLREEDHAKYSHRGHQELGSYLDKRLNVFKPDDLIELDFKHQSVAFGPARLTGRIDRVSLDKARKRGIVSDFKTGRPLASWQRLSGNDGLKAWRYRTQLIFYKLLMEQSRSWSEYTIDQGVLEFIQPLRGDNVLLEYNFEAEEIERVKKLIQAVWQCIQSLDFPDVSNYTKDLTGIKKFENDLLKEAKK